ncbi:MAG: hypothetical protein ACC707_07200, partial [Thiohalomonadales bacterium]
KIGLTACMDIGRFYRVNHRLFTQSLQFDCFLSVPNLPVQNLPAPVYISVGATNVTPRSYPE